MHDIIKESYFEYVERMNETLVDFVFAYKTALTKSVQSPTKYSGTIYLKILKINLPDVLMDHLFIFIE